MGMTLREIIFELGGGIPDGQEVQGGADRRAFGRLHSRAVSSICRVDYDSLAAVGSIMGSGGMIVMDETSCMVDVARFFMDFCMTESCGKCVPCRVGTTQMHNMLERITRGQAEPARPGVAGAAERHGQGTSLCGLGQTAPNPVAEHAALFPGRVSSRNR